MSALRWVVPEHDVAVAAAQLSTLESPRMETPDLRQHIRSIAESPLAPWADRAPWELTQRSEHIVRELLGDCSASDYLITQTSAGDIAVHRSAIVENGAVLKGPLILGPQVFVAAGAYLRGGCWVDARCIFGPGSELKSSFVFAGSKLAHFNFVGDSVLGADVNLEAGSIVCNYRNERADKQVRWRDGDQLLGTGCDKFGALIGDHARVGANAVLAPGAVLRPGEVVRRALLRDDEMPTR
jgi:UDP-N-acetylglucosamine diphosphorylase / glucose-1-phosphate thymidylyltransferase / UDP-N-acetylgalactosamine diphosphorylase / glucosamine-1-phosphate N-acetyltransferase / galactosamine-1-phosphate N-acetyltransferase